MTTDPRPGYMTMRSSDGSKQSVYCVGVHAYARCLSMFLCQFDPFQSR